jgi:hypothetical protein
MTYRTHTTVMMAALALAVTACGGDDDSEPASEKPAGTTAAKTSAAPYGTYVREVTKRDLARTDEARDEAGPHQQLPPAGEYRLVIAKGAGQDVLKATDPGGFTVAMDMDAADEVVELTEYVDPSKASFCGPEVPAAANYAFKAESSTLSLEPRADDPCADRDSILTGTWTEG